MNKVSIYGGLGNQMFQYAFCTALNKEDKKAQVSFSTYLYYYHHNGFDLTKAFQIALPFKLKVLNFILHKAQFLYKNKLAAAFFRRFITAYHKRKYSTYPEKKEFEFDPEIFDQQAVFFVGTWQVAQYFDNVQELLKDKFKFKMPADAENSKLIEQINACEAVSIHIRRGDYFNDHWKNTLAIIKDNTYYLNAVAHINSTISLPVYFIFSDDIEWAKEHLQMPGCVYINNNKGSNSYVDMYLMSICKHNIIANSTFSWWAAWLNKNPNKIVVMPEKWMNNNNCAGMFPKEWIKAKV
jgi:hypothetical protein